MDVLPQPYRFINKCLDALIMKPVFNTITNIEERKKTPEYEGNIKEVFPTGYMELDGATAIGSMKQVVLAGGLIEKHDNMAQSAGVHSKLIVGDNSGCIHLVDASRKVVMNKKELPQFEGRRINNISTATLEWVDSKLTLAAVVARGSPIVHIVAFKHNENKFHHFYSVKVCPDLENPESLETNEGQTYTCLPAEV